MAFWLLSFIAVLFKELQIANAATSTPTQSTFQYLSNNNCANSPWMESQTGGSPVTSIDIFTSDTQGTQLYAFQVNGLADVVPLRTTDCTATKIATLNLASTVTITKIETWYDISSNYHICQVKFTMSNMTTQTYTTTNTSYTNCVLTTATFSPQNQFVGFWGRGGTAGYCNSGCLVAESVSCSKDSITAIDVSSFNAGSLILLFGASQTKTLSATKAFSITICAINYKITVTPTGPCTSLITLSGNTLTFAPSNDLANAAVCTIAVQASIGEVIPTVWSAATTATFTYVNPCSSATIAFTCPSSFQVNIGTPNSSSAPALTDSVTTTINNGTIICPLSYQLVVQSAPSSTGNSTMYANFLWTQTSSLNTITASPTLAAEAGTYVLNATACTSANTSNCASCLVTVGVICNSPSADINKDSYGSPILSAQTWTPGSVTDTFTYNILVDTATTCGLKPSAWTLTATSTTNPQNVTLFQSIMPNAGTNKATFTVGPFTDLSIVGVYTISVTSLTIGGIVYTSITNTATQPGSFQLIVINPCASQNINANGLNNLNVGVFGTQTVNSPVWSVNNNLCNLVYTVWFSIAPSALVNSTMSTKLTLQTASNRIYITAAPTLNSEIGNYQITVKACIAEFNTTCQTRTTSLIVTACTIGLSGDQVLQQSSDKSGLKDQIWQVTGLTPFTYQLELDPTYTCGLTITAWQVTVIPGTGNSTFNSELSVMPTSGLYSIGPYSNNSMVGTYRIRFQSVTLSNSLAYNIYNSPTIPFQFTLTITAAANTCGTATVTSSTISNFNVIAYAPSTTYGTFPSFTYVDVNGLTTCGTFTYSVSLALGTATSPLSTFTLNSASLNFQVFSGNLNQVGTFTATLVGKLTSYPSQQASTQFTITVVNPCLQTTLAATSSLSAMNYQIQAVSATQQTPTINDAVDSSQSQTLQICGGLTYQINDAAASGVTALSSTQLTVSPTGLISVQTSNVATSGTHTVTLISKLTQYPSVILSQTFTLTISCVITSINVMQQSSLGILQTQTYSVPSTTAFTYQLAFGLSPQCGYSPTAITITTTSIDNAVSVSNFQSISATGLFTAGPFTSVTTAGTYNVSVTSITLNGVVYATSSIINTVASPNSFQLTVINQCQQTTLFTTPTAGLSLSPMTYQIGQTPSSIQQQSPSFNDGVDSSQGLTLTICGDLTYQISDSPNLGVTALSTTDLTVSSSGLITVQSSNAANVGTHTINLNVKLTSYSSIVNSLSFTLTILACQINSIQMTSPSIQSYTIGQPLQSWTLINTIAVQTPACGYPLILSVDLSTAPSIVTASPSGSTITFSVQSQVGGFNPSYNIQIIAQPQNYPFSPIQSGNCVQTLNLIDPCASTIITGPTTVENLVTFAGQSVSSSIYTFNDTVSQTFTVLGSIKDFCGNKTFTYLINSMGTNLLSGQNQEQITFSPSNSSSSGTQIATLRVSLQNNPSITKAINFNVTTLESKVQNISDQIYQVGTTNLNFTFGQFAILPSSYVTENPIQNTLSLYILNNVTDLQKTELNCSCLTLISNQTWIKFDETTNSIQVATSDIQLIGNYSLAVVQTFPSFPKVRYFSKFMLTIKNNTQNLTNTNVKAVDLTPAKSQVNITYQIGGTNAPIDLIQYYNLTNNQQYIIKFQIFQISGLSFNNYTIDLNNHLQIYATETKYSQSQVQFQVQVTTNLTNQIPNQDLILTISFVTDSSSSSSQNTQSNAINSQNETEKTNYMFQGVKLPKLNQVQDRNKERVIYPAKIKSVTNLGLVTIQFQHAVYVPQFSQSNTSTTSPQNLRNLNSQAKNLTLQEVIDSFTLDVKLKTSKGFENVDWYCTNFTKQILLIQLVFSNPLAVSSNGFDNIIVKFIQPNLFLLNTMDSYLFSEEYQETLTAQIPPQFPSKQAMAAFTSISAAASKSAPAIITITLILQIIAKKVISSMFIYYSVLQIILLINLDANVQFPASVNFFSNTIDGIINLSSFDKKMITEKINLPASTFQENSLLSKLGAIAFAIILILMLAVCILIARKFNLGEKIKNLMRKAVKFIFWNFLIRYFQVAFINFNLSALITVQNPQTVGDQIVSSSILVVLYSIVILIVYILLKRQLWELSLQQTRDSIGNLYVNLYVFSRKKVLYGAMFYIQRILVVLIIAIKIDFCLQWAFVQLVLMLNTSYLFYVSPYANWSDGQVDYFNTVLLLITVQLIVLVTPFVTNTTVRYQYGIYFDTFIGFGLVTNLFYIVYLTIKPTQLKLKRIFFQRQLKIKKAQEQLEKAQRIQELLKKRDELQQQQASMISKQQSNTKVNTNSTQQALVSAKSKSLNFAMKKVDQQVTKIQKSDSQQRNITLLVLSDIEEEKDQVQHEIVKKSQKPVYNENYYNQQIGSPIAMPKTLKIANLKLPSYDEVSDTSDYFAERQVVKKQAVVQKQIKPQSQIRVPSQDKSHKNGLLEQKNLKVDQKKLEYKSSIQTQGPLQSFGLNPVQAQYPQYQSYGNNRTIISQFETIPSHQMQNTQYKTEIGMSAQDQLKQLMQMRIMQQNTLQLQQQQDFSGRQANYERQKIATYVHQEETTFEKMRRLAEQHTQKEMLEIFKQEKKQKF